MGAVFVSYRREVSEGQARALSLELVRLLGKDSVFMDVDGIALGRDFRQVLQERLNSCDVMLTLIGPGWVDVKDGSGMRRLDSPTDFVRLEIAAALKRNIPVIPVLLQGAQVPPPERLPDDLKDLSYRNGFEVGHATWESDVREMVRRLGLSASNTTDAASSPSGTNDASPVSSGAAWPSWLRLRVAAVIGLLVAAAGLVIYFYPTTQRGDEPIAEVTPSQASKGAAVPATEETALPATAPSGTTPLPKPASTEGSGLAASGIEFQWPGNDCWSIFRGAELVTHQCGTGKQVLSAGRYTIKGRYAAVFLPFDVDIKPDTPARISQGGVFEFAWPGNDCWTVFRGEELVTHQCGTAKQALGAGRYTIKGRYAPVFTPVTVDIKDGSLTRLAMGGVFEFAWPGKDCWTVFRGEELVTHQCGTAKQALGAGRYTIKGRYAPVFTPFDITVSDGAAVKKP